MLLFSPAVPARQNAITPTIFQTLETVPTHTFSVSIYFPSVVTEDSSFIDDIIQPTERRCERT